MLEALNLTLVRGKVEVRVLTYLSQVCDKHVIGVDRGRYSQVVVGGNKPKFPIRVFN